jgi:DNA-binding NarL/FixJ family response regulator
MSAADNGRASGAPGGRSAAQVDELESESAVRIAIDNDFPVVIQGLSAMLSQHGHRVQVVPLDAAAAQAAPAELVLKDAFAMNDDLAAYVAQAPARVVVFATSDDRSAVDAALAQGAVGYIHKGVSVDGLIEALHRIRAGEQVVELASGPGTRSRPVGTPDWPGREHGLTDRESEVLSLICQGMSNQDVAKTLYLSINSVKTYIRTMYRKIGAESRSQAVIWGLKHGFSPDG